MVRTLGLQGPVADAFLATPREVFVPEWVPRIGLSGIYRPEAPLATKTDANGQAISSSSAPAVMAPMLTSLDLQPGHRVLEIGTGTGYNAALLAHLVGPRGKVVSIELDPDIAKAARAALRSVGARVRVVTGDGHRGVPEAAPFDRVIATAAAPTVPRAWFEQLHDGGLVEFPFQTVGIGALPTLVKEGDRLLTRSVILGGFMGMRRSSDDAGTRHPAVSSGEQTTRSQRAAYLAGPVITSLGRAGRRSLRRVLADAPSVARWGKGAEPIGYLLVAGRRAVQYQGDAGWGAGVVAESGLGAAVVARTPRGLKRLTWGTGAEHLLDEQLTAWRTLGQPGLERLRLTISFPKKGPGRIRRSWAAPS